MREKFTPYVSQISLLKASFDICQIRLVCFLFHTSFFHVSLLGEINIFSALTIKQINKRSNSLLKKRHEMENCSPFYPLYKPLCQCCVANFVYSFTKISLASIRKSVPCVSKKVENGSGCKVFRKLSQSARKKN